MARESANTHAGNRSLGAPRDHHIGIAVLNNAEGVANRMRARRAGRGRRFIRSLGPMAHGNLSGSQVNDGRGNEKRRDLARATLHQCGVLPLDDVEPANSRSDVHSDSLIIFGSDLQT